MNQNNQYNFTNSISVQEVRDFREKLGITQREFAILLGVSKPSVERMENSDKDITGPIAILINLLEEDDELLNRRVIPERKYPLRLWYMYKNKRCTLIDVDDMRQTVNIVNYTKNIMFCAFGIRMNPTYDEYLEFLESRCFPRTRDKIKVELDVLGLPFYDPFMIIEKTEGRMAEDDFWIKIER